VIHAVRPDVVYVNTVTLPWWLLAARLTRTPVLCHIHEAEDVGGRAVLTALNAPLLLANRLISNSQASFEATCGLVPGLRQRNRLVYNGVPSPVATPAMPEMDSRPFRLVVVGRLSPRKAQDVALEAVAILRSEGQDVELEVCGTPFEGYEWYAEQLRQRAEREDLAGHVTLSGYVSPIGPALARAHAVVAPSLREPFGNAVVEAQLALRPVVASEAMGHKETVQDGVTGLLVEPDDAQALAKGVARLMDDSDLARSLAEQGRRQAEGRFSTDRDNADIVALVEDLAR
jgi:glycosyltransferase involved in cell wall biosynthesis